MGALLRTRPPGHGERGYAGQDFPAGGHTADRSTSRVSTSATPMPTTSGGTHLSGTSRFISPAIAPDAPCVTALPTGSLRSPGSRPNAESLGQEPQQIGRAHV